MSLDTLFLIGRPFSPIYAALMRARYLFYKKGIFSSYRPQRPVISIGNLSMGGTGKTPHVIEIANFLLKRSLRVTVLTRGYGSRVGKGPFFIDDKHKDPFLVGDEPVLIYESVKGINVIVGSNRVEAAKRAMESLDVDIFLLDDGFQHLALKRDLDIVLLPYESPFSDGKVFPGGYLREPISAINRANCLILTDSLDLYDQDYRKAEVHELFPHIPVFLSKKSVINLTNLRGDVFKCDYLKDKKVVGFCGIAHPDSFKNMLLSQECKICNFLEFKDHYHYNIQDIEVLFDILNKSSAHFLVTTLKDSVKLRDILRFIDNKEIIERFLRELLVLNIKVEIESGFWLFLESFLNNYLEG